MKKLRNVLSLFDGMSCGQIALLENRMKFDKYYASEIDKHAIAQTQLNFPDTVQLGDVNDWLLWGIDWSKIDLILAGSPCQGFSSAGKQLAFDDPRSALFFTFVDILKYARRKNPNVRFLLENVKMKQEHLSVITKHVGVHPVMIDAALVSAQERKRYYWTDVSDSVDPPADRGVLVEHIVCSNAPVELTVEMGLKSPTVRKTYANATMPPFRFTGANIKGCGVKDETGKYARAFRYNVKGKAYTLTTKTDATYLTDGAIVRHPTNRELTKLQGLPMWYTWGCPRTQMVKLLGNGWNVEVIKHILSYYGNEST